MAGYFDTDEWGHWKWFLIIFMIILYLVLNIVGSVYYSELDVDPGVEGVCLTTVIAGWFGFPLFNLTSPIVWTKTNGVTPKQP